METNEDIRAKDILPHKTAFSEGDGFYGDGDTSFFMEADKLMELTAQNALAMAPDFTTGKNLIDKAKFSELGEWCNYTDGVIESTAYTTNYRHTPYIKVSASTEYARRSISNAQYGAGRMAGIVFFDSEKNFISGTQSGVFTTPANCAYIIENIDVRIESVDQAVLIESGTAYPESSPNLPYYNDFKYPNPAYVTKEYINDNIVSPLLFVTSENLLNKATMSAQGEWCNYTDGKIESTQYTTNYRHSQFIKVEPSTSYARRSIINPSYGAGRMAGIVFFDSEKNFISGTQSGVFTTPANCAYIIENIDVRIESVDQAVLIESGTAYPESSPNLPYYNDFKYPNPAYTERDYVTVGASDADFTSVGAAFTFARANDKWVLIKPGVYDLVAEGISGEGYILPKKVVGYGAKLVCDLPEEDWDLSPLNTKPSAGNSFEVYGLEIECSNCRYCIHDDMGSSTNRTPYHNIFKDLTLTHKSPISEVLLQPLNIGGGFGDGGYIEIVNCKMTATMSTNFTYHSNPFNQQASSVIQCHHNYLNKRAYIGSSGTPAEGVTNTFYVSDCVFGTYKPQSGVDGALITKAWNNVLESSLQ